MSLILTIVDKLLQDNNIFGANGFFYKNSLEFDGGGVDDAKFAMFYIRQVAPSTVRNGQIPLVKTYYRAVFQLPNKVDLDVAELAMSGQLMAMDGVNVTRYSQDKALIMRLEYEKVGIPMHFNIVMVDFEIETERYPGNCECLTIENC